MHGLIAGYSNRAFTVGGLLLRWLLVRRYNHEKRSKGAANSATRRRYSMNGGGSAHITVKPDGRGLHQSSNAMRK